MNMVAKVAGFPGPRAGKCILIFMLTLSLGFVMWPPSLTSRLEAQAPPPAAPPPPYTQETPEQLQQLVAPIALYPDSLVAQILAASTFPEQVVEADRWVQDASGFEGRGFGSSGGPTALGPERQGADGVPLRPGEHGQEHFLDVLSGRCLLQPAAGCDGSRPGDAPDGRKQAGNLKTTPQQTVATQGSDIIIQPANPDMVYVPAYDPWLVYGDPMWRGRDGIRIPGSGLAGRTSRLESASESASSEGLGGAGGTGDSTGVAATPL